MNKILKASVATIAILSSNMLILNTSAVAAEPDMEKCYGVVKAGWNDCATKNSSCVGTSSVDGQKSAFVAVPKGLCKKLSGGSLMSS